MSGTEGPLIDSCWLPSFLHQSAYECLSTILETFQDILDMRSFVVPLIAGLRDNNDIKLVICLILQRVWHLKPCILAESKSN